MTRPEAWESFFTGPYLHFQREARTGEEIRAAAELMERLLRLAPASRVLDAPCGSGPHAVELAARGHFVTGVDYSAPLVEEARQRAAGRGVEARFEQRDMRELPWAAAFDAVLCAWGSFGYFDDAGNAAFLEAVSRALVPGGRLLLDVDTTETLFRDFQERHWWRSGSLLVIEEWRYDFAASRLERQWSYLTGGEQATRRLSVRIYTYRELCATLAAAGFTGVQAYDGATGEAFGVRSPRLLLVATRV